MRGGSLNSLHKVPMIIGKNWKTWHGLLLHQTSSFTKEMLCSFIKGLCELVVPLCGKGGGGAR